jgi:hypothetical protein
MTSNVYLLRCQNRYKIGIAGNVAARLATLQVSAPFAIEHVAHSQVDDAAALERELHSAYAHYRIVGEWFELSEADVQDVMQTLQKRGVLSFEIPDNGGTTTLRIEAPTLEEASMMRILTPADKLAALLEAAKEKVAKA